MSLANQQIVRERFGLSLSLSWHHVCEGARTHTCTHILILAYTNWKDGALREWGVKSESIMIVTDKSTGDKINRQGAHVYPCLQPKGYQVSTGCDRCRDFLQIQSIDLDRLRKEDDPPSATDLCLAHSYGLG